MHLFLDRDGVINQRTPGQYVNTPDGFILLPNVKEAITMLRTHFEHVFVVTNQAGVNKGLCTQAELALVHQQMHALLPGLIDGVWYCPHRPDQRCNCRKPQSGMAWMAQFAHARVQFKHSWMVGDSASDIAFGSRLGMRTVRVGTKPGDSDLFVGECAPEFTFADLMEFAQYQVKV